MDERGKAPQLEIYEEVKSVIFNIKVLPLIVFALSLFVYNLNKYYLRYLSMEEDWFRITTDVLPNFVIVITFFSILSISQKYFTLANKYRSYYIWIAIFCVLLSIEEYTGIFNMSKVSDINDAIASYTSSGLLLMVLEARRRSKKYYFGLSR